MSSSSLLILRLNFSSNFTRSLAEQVISLASPDRYSMRRLIFNFYPYAVALVTAPVVGSVISKVSRSPILPDTGT